VQAGQVIESDLIRLRAREGMKVAKAQGGLRGKQPKTPESGSPNEDPISANPR
jgi:DNA invertase Pin-like site-specific DNA recombinase